MRIVNFLVTLTHNMILSVDIRRMEVVLNIE
jgi:hypothetical protein